MARLERGERLPRPVKLAGIIEVFEDQGIRFLRDDHGCGVYVAEPSTT